MNLIIDLIIKIFQAVFEREQRRREPYGGQHGDAQARARQTQSPPKNLDEWLESLLGVEPEQKPPPRPKKRPAPPKRAKPPPIPAVEETFAIGSELFETGAQQDDSGEIGGKADLLGSAKPGITRLPGKNLLEQMIYAQVILGPCKARQKSHRSVMER